MKRKRAILATLCIIALLVGCDGAKDRKEGTPSQATGPQSATPTSDSAPDQEATAKGKLKEALDAWVFGDSPEKFMKEHPDVQSISAEWAQGKVMMRYEIGASRKSPLGSEFAVTLVFQSKAGTEIKKSVIWKVWPPHAGTKERWTLLGNAE